MSRAAATTALKITDPLVKYNSLLSSGIYVADPGQHRLAIHLQKIYSRLKDYSPSTEYGATIRKLSRDIEDATRQDPSEHLAVKSHPIRGNPLFRRFFRASRTQPKDSLALTKVLSSHEAAIHIESPKGIFVSGEVGTGKSALIDLLADGLPTGRKRRWHFNTFMLYTLSRLEQFRKSHPTTAILDEREYSLLWLAKELAEQSPILFLDEFQMPDRASSKILNNLLIAFFQLGGVLVASSNRMPEELERASGMHYARPASNSGLLRTMFGFGQGQSSRELFGSSSDFANFLEVLRARCDFWQMEGARDWRRETCTSRDVDSPSGLTIRGELAAESQTTVVQVSSAVVGHDSGVDDTNVTDTQPTLPEYYLTGVDTGESWSTLLNGAGCNISPAGSPWTKSQIFVYGRLITIDQQYEGLCKWEFEDLMRSLGPADYISLASTFHTFIIDNIPVLTHLLKNETRRFITLLDALYEARCKLHVRAAAGPDDLFFPEVLQKPDPRDDLVNEISGNASARPVGDATYSETVAEVFQDQISPFRPNVSSYNEDSAIARDPDHDSDLSLQTGVNFVDTSAFTGEDERFAYKRAASRLWEMCGAQWHARSGDWWQPLPTAARHWETKPADVQLSQKLEAETATSDVVFGPSVDLNEPAGLAGQRLQELTRS